MHSRRTFMPAAVATACILPVERSSFSLRCGAMISPAAGRGIAELIDKGRFKTFDLSRLNDACVLKHEPYPERGIA